MSQQWPATACGRGGGHTHLGLVNLNQHPQHEEESTLLCATAECLVSLLGLSDECVGEWQDLKNAIPHLLRPARPLDAYGKLQFSNRLARFALRRDHRRRAEVRALPG